MSAPSRRTQPPRNRERLPAHFESLEKAAEFWDTHDSAEYEDSMRDVKVRTRIRGRRYLISLDTHLFRKVETIARERGISAETLVNMWIQEKAS